MNEQRDWQGADIDLFYQDKEKATPDPLQEIISKLTRYEQEGEIDGETGVTLSANSIKSIVTEIIKLRNQVNGSRERVSED